jgi:hypothetical protein
MCLIIRKPRGRRIPADFLREAWRHNHHGWGAVTHGPQAGAVPLHAQPAPVQWHKGMCLESLLRHNQALPLEAEAHVHLRRATAGEVHTNMAHPHVVRDDAQARVLLMHNGTIAALAPGGVRDVAASGVARAPSAAASACCGSANTAADTHPALRLLPAGAGHWSDSAVLARWLGQQLAGLSAPEAARRLRCPSFARELAPLIEGSMVVLLDALGSVTLGREWHAVRPDQWHRGMWGIEVSNTRTWQPMRAEALAAA